MNFAKLSAAFVVGAVSLAAAHAPALAASPATNAFMTNVMSNVDFLDRSSRFALTNSKNAKLKDFAHSEAAEQTLAINALYDWTQADKAALVASAAPGAGEPPLQTGRSVAVDGQKPQVVDNRLPMGQEDLDSLEGLNGPDFDAQFKDKQRDALTQIQTDYETYIAKGDDPVLLGIANRELPKVKRRLAGLAKM